MVRRPFDGGSPRGNQYFHASKGWAPSTRSTSLKASLGTMVCSSRPLSVSRWMPPAASASSQKVRQL